MKNSLTVFVVGAGASKEVGLPIASELIDIIADKIDFQLERGTIRDDRGDADILDVIQEASPGRVEINAFFDAANRLRNGVIFSNSIDSFIDVHRHDEKILRLGKLAIGKTILEREGNSYLQIEGSKFKHAEELRATWFVRLFKNLCDGVRKSEMHTLFEKIAFVVFNYDRCIEHFLFNAIKLHFGITTDEAAEIMKTLRIIHPYGSVGTLPWEDRNGIPYGFEGSRETLKFVEKRIKTYTEQVEDLNTIKNIRSLVESADALVFLGFSYHPQNMTLIDPSDDCAAEEVFGTAFGISNNDVAIINDRIRVLVGRNLDPLRHVVEGVSMRECVFIRNDLTCASLLDEFSRSLFTAGPLR